MKVHREQAGSDRHSQYDLLQKLVLLLPRFLQEAGAWLPIPAAEDITCIWTVWLVMRYDPGEVERP